MPRRLLLAALLATATTAIAVAPAAAAPDNGNTLRFVLTCDDGPTPLTLDADEFLGKFFLQLVDQLFLGKQIAPVTPAGDSGVIQHGLEGFSGAGRRVHLHGAVSGNAYTVTGFYPNTR
jgi:hypothetical protein